MSTESGFVPHHALVTAPGAAPARWMLVLHGIFGSGANWRTFARRLADARPEWGFVLVDLRAHGLSQDPPPPHTVGAAADDLRRLDGRLGLDVRGVMGHSFGGKVALAYAARRPGELSRAFVLDSHPGAQPEAARTSPTRGVLELLASIPQPMPSRERFLEIVQASGQTRAVAEWLAMNVRRAEDGFRLRMDLDALGALVADYFVEDLWPVVEDPRSAGRLVFVIGGRSVAIREPDRARLEALAERAPRLSVRVLPTAGHWLHVDDPEGLFAALRDALG
ncbi:MAG: alpha/beta hydrolase [Polyangiaceae bacterium]|nr:alpha/beta hydrolase [Polyangiaceae bacterium]